jgi:hypothetical protein
MESGELGRNMGPSVELGIVFLDEKTARVSRYMMTMPKYMA